MGGTGVEHLYCSTAQRFCRCIVPSLYDVQVQTVGSLREGIHRCELAVLRMTIDRVNKHTELSYNIILFNEEAFSHRSNITNICLIFCDRNRP